MTMDTGFHYLSDEERAELTEQERYEYDECCSANTESEEQEN